MPDTPTPKPPAGTAHLDFLRRLSKDPPAAKKFLDDPQKYLRSEGLDFDPAILQAIIQAVVSGDQVVTLPSGRTLKVPASRKGLLIAATNAVAIYATTTVGGALVASAGRRRVGGGG